MNFDRLTEFLDGIPTYGAPGVDCLVMKDGETVYRHMAGYADREEKRPMKGDELFYLYSSSKPITCTAALQMLERGKFLLTDPLENYLPEFAEMKVNARLGSGELRPRRAKRSITVGDLFGMTAGFDYNLNAPELREEIEKNPNASTRELVRALAKRPLNFDPGDYWMYSLCHDVLGTLIEAVSGMSFGEYLEKNIFRPLGMNDTGFNHDEEVKSRMMAQYEYDLDTKQVNRIGLDNEFILTPAYESGGAGLVSSVEDYSRFASMMANGGSTPDGERIISPASIELMRTNRLTKQAMETFDWTHYRGYGYGLGVRTLMDRAAAGSTSPVGEFGWSGAAGTYVLIDPDNRINLFYAQHMRNSLGAIITPRMRNILYACL